MATDTANACERIARSQGLAAGLALALAGLDVAATSPGRYAAIPAEQAPAAGPVATHSLAEREQIVFLDCGRARAPGAVRDRERLAELGRRLAAVRLGLTRRLLDAAVAHLSARSGGGEPLIRKQMIIAEIADVITGIELLREYALNPAGGGIPLDRDAPYSGAVADLHARITDLDWRVIRLFGAAGYLADHPVRALYVSALVANTWIPQGADR